MLRSHYRNYGEHERLAVLNYDGHFMVDEPVKTIIDHELTMINHSQSVVALTTMTMVINYGLNEWVDHGQPWPEYWL